MRFFVQNALTLGESFTLPDDVFHHWCKVLRATVGERAVLFNGQGGEYHAILSHLDKKHAQVQIHHFDPINRTLPYQVRLAQAISKNDHMDYTIQKACELGVSTIQLITSERSERLRYERDQKKLAHWQKIAQSACEQCGLNVIPQILPPIGLDEFVANCDDDLKIILSLSSPNNAFDMTQSLPSTISLLVGAEGGLSDDEINLTHTHGFVSWTMGERVLRTETAGVVAMANLQLLHQLNSPLILAQKSQATQLMTKTAVHPQNQEL